MSTDSSLASKFYWVDDNRTFDTITPRWLIIHKTAGFHTVDDLGVYFQTNAGMVTSHYGVGLEGEIAQFVHENRGACANCCLSNGHASFLPDDGRNFNNWTISIEHIDPATDNSTPLTPKQQEASFPLIKDICTRNNIPMRYGDANGGIIFHHDLDPVNRSRCPGNYPYDALWAYLDNGGTTMGTTDGFPDKWNDDGTTLTAPNGQKVTGGFRMFIYHNPWDNDDYPITGEIHTDRLEDSNTSLGGGTIQYFRKSTLEVSSDPKHPGCFRGWVGQELYKVKQEQTADTGEDKQAASTIANLDKEIASLKAQLAAVQPSPQNNQPVISDDVKNNIRQLVTISGALAKEAQV